MILYIDTTYNNEILIILKRGRDLILAKKKFKALFKQAEKLLPAIEKLLKDNKLKLSNLSGIEVKNSGGSFTALRIGVVTANALAYALKLPLIADGQAKTIKSGGVNFKVVCPAYDREPEITVKKLGKTNV